jgi:integral membrane sensor domain MASE1
MSGPEASETRQPGLKDFVFLPLLYFVSAKIAVVLSVMPEGMGILWPPNGVLLAYFIRFGRRSYLPFGLLAVLAELAVDVPKYPVSVALLYGLTNVTEVTIASLLLARAQFNPRFAHVADLAKFVVAGPVTAAFIGALSGALVSSRLPGSDTGYFDLLRIWWFGDALGLMIMTPLLLGVWSGTQALPQLSASADAPADKPRPRLTDGLLAAGALGIVGLLLAARNGTFMGTHVGPVLLLPFAIAAGVRLGSAAAAIAVSAITLLILVLTTQGRNPFGASSPREAVIHAQEFVFVLSVMTLGLAALVSHVRTLNEDLEQRVRARTSELQDALTHVKELRGLLPICAWCKRVRDDHDYWHSVEEYISDRTDAQFSHGICPDCVAEVDTAAPPDLMAPRHRVRDRSAS